jgi:hypothetical protein
MIVWKGGRPNVEARPGPDGLRQLVGGEDDDYVTLLALLTAGKCPESQMFAAIAKWTQGHFNPVQLARVMRENGLNPGAALGGPLGIQQPEPAADPSTPWPSPADVDDCDPSRRS